jgi:hypothetical protein
MNEPNAAKGRPAGRLAEISPVEDPFAGRIMSNSFVIFGLVLGLLIVPLFLGSGVMTLGGFYLCSQEARNDGWPAALTDNAVFIVALGIPLLLGSIYVAFRCPNLFAEWCLRRRAKREIRSRPDWIVDPDDPEAMFVQIVPRCNWGRIMLETATDVGFLKVDASRREILFEGDKERYRISRIGHRLVRGQADRLRRRDAQPHQAVHDRAPCPARDRYLGEANRSARRFRQPRRRQATSPGTGAPRQDVKRPRVRISLLEDLRVAQADPLRLDACSLPQKRIMVLLKFMLDRFQVLPVVDKVRNIVFRQSFLLQSLIMGLLILLQGFDCETSRFQ